MHLVVQRSRSNLEVTFLKKWPFRGHSGFTNTSCFKMLSGHTRLLLFFFFKRTLDQPALTWIYFSSPTKRLFLRVIKGLDCALKMELILFVLYFKNFLYFKVI